LKYTTTTSYIDVLTSEVTLLSAQLNGVNDKVEQLQSIVALYQSLGGGWR
jgi:outer membrane protein TolC